MKLCGNNRFGLRNNNLCRLQNGRFVSLRICAKKKTLPEYILEGFLMFALESLIYLQTVYS